VPSDDLRGDSEYLDDEAYYSSYDYEQEQWDNAMRRTRKATSTIHEIEAYCTKHNNKNHVAREVLRLIKEWRDG